MPLLKAITIRQPWAWLLTSGAVQATERGLPVKRVENRSWRTRHRGPVAIHASQSRQELKALSMGAGRWPLPEGVAFPEESELCFGKVVAVADLVDVLPVELWKARHPQDAFAVGPYCMILERVRLLPRPFAAKGSQMLWDLDLPDAVWS